MISTICHYYYYQRGHSVAMGLDNLSWYHDADDVVVVVVLEFPLDNHGDTGKFGIDVDGSLINIFVTLLHWAVDVVTANVTVLHLKFMSSTTDDTKGTNLKSV